MNILALDMGTRTGWATKTNIIGQVVVDQIGTCSGVQEFKLERGESAGMRHLRFGRWIEDMVGLVKPGLIAYEQSFLLPTAHASEIFFGFITRTQSVCALQGIEYMSVNAMKLKKWTTGYGRASKEDMVKHVNERWKRGVTDHDEADAVALLHYVLSQLPKE